MKRILSIFFPTWATDLIRLRHKGNSGSTPKIEVERPIFLTTELRGAEVVVRCSLEAENRGVYNGMSRTHAELFCPNAWVESFSEERNTRNLKKLASALMRFSPLISLDKSPYASSSPLNDGINLDITGCERVFGGELQLIRMLRAYIGRFKLSSRLTIAPSLGSAWAVSRFGEKQINIIRNASAAILHLPLEALRIDAATRESLNQVGIKTVIELLKIPRPELTERFGATLLRQLRRALGEEEEAFDAIHSSPLPTKEFIFDSPVISSETLCKLTRLLLEQSLETYKNSNEQVCSLQFIFKRMNASPLTLSLSLNLPSADPSSLWYLLKPRIEAVHMGDGIEAIKLTLTDVEHARPKTTDFNAQANYDDFKKRSKALIDRLTAYLGPLQVLQGSLQASYFPEHSFNFVSALAATPSSPINLPYLERPSLLLETPLKVKTISLLPDHPPRSVQLKTNSYKVIRGIGPERIFPEWWNENIPKHQSRDYFKLQLESGTWIWLYRENKTAEWYLHGLWA